MQFPTVAFTLFFVTFLIVWWALPRQTVARTWVLIAGSLLFYAASGLQWVGVLLAVSVVAWGGSRWIASSSRPKLAGWVTVGALVLNLVAWKYTQWAVSMRNDWAEMFHWSLWELPEWALPVGLSFFTFHALAIVLAVWNKGMTPYAFSKVLAQISFFPALLAGPVLKEDAIAPRLNQPFVWASVKWVVAVGMIMLGMTFKWVLSTHAADVSDPVFQGLGASVVDVWWGVHAYGAQIFFDFAGYSLMAIGVAMLLGFELPPNFTQPYMATSAKEFWGSWHRSLSFFFRDNLYIQVFGGNRNGKIVGLLAAASTMLVSGLWHGASLTFVVWGAWHAAWLVGERLIPGRDAWPKWLGWIVSIEIAMWGWVWFRAENWSAAVDVFRQGWGFAQLPLGTLPSLSVVVWSVLGVMMVFAERRVLWNFEILEARLDRGVHWMQWPTVAFVGVWAWAIMLWGPVGVPPFIYNGF